MRRCRRSSGNPHLAIQASHFVDVLRMYSMNDTACTQEQQCFKESMRQQMEYAAR